MPFPEADCEICGKTFQKKTSNHKYCSAECRAIAGDLSANADRFLVYKRDSFRCSYCGRSPMTSQSVTLVLDHIHPVVRGGNDSCGNLITTCYSCNAAKHSESLGDLEEWVLEEVARRNEVAGISPQKLIKGVHR